MVDFHGRSPRGVHLNLYRLAISCRALGASIRALTGNGRSDITVTGRNGGCLRGRIDYTCRR